ncbi:MAG: hypothetical protein ABI183_13415 [Polyangiaceae bacterium]
MWIEAVVAKEDLIRVAHKFAPLELKLGDAGGTLRLEDPSEISLIPTVGLHLQCTAHLHWPVLGMKIPVTIKPLIVRVIPEIDKREKGDALVFKLQIEHADVATVPTIIDNEITNLINRELIKKKVDFAFHFADVLSHEFALSKVLPQIRSLGLKVVGGNVRVTEDAFVLCVSIEANVTRESEQAEGSEEVTKPDSEQGKQRDEHVA